MSRTRSEPRPATEVALGTVWFVWGKHQEVAGERPAHAHYEREVKLQPLDSQGRPQGKPGPWVEAWRVLRYGHPSGAFS